MSSSQRERTRQRHLANLSSFTRFCGFVRERGGLRLQQGVDVWVATQVFEFIGQVVPRSHSLNLQGGLLLSDGDPQDVPLVRFDRCNNKLYIFIGDVTWRGESPLQSNRFDDFASLPQLLQDRLVESVNSTTSAVPQPRFAEPSATHEWSAIDFSNWYGGNVTQWPIQMSHGQSFATWTLSWLNCALMSEAFHGPRGRFPFVSAAFFENVPVAVWQGAVVQVHDLLNSRLPNIQAWPNSNMHWETGQQETVMDLFLDTNPELYRDLFTCIGRLVDLEALALSSNQRVNLAFNTDRAVPEPPSHRLRLDVTVPGSTVPLAGSTVPVADPMDVLQAETIGTNLLHDHGRADEVQPNTRPRRERRETAAATLGRENEQQLRQQRELNAQQRAAREQNTMLREERLQHEATLRELLEHQPLHPDEDVSKLFENHPLVKQLATDFKQLVSSCATSVCSDCSEIMLSRPEASICIDCKHDKSRKLKFGAQATTMPTILRYQQDWSRQFFGARVEDESLADSQRRALQITSKIPRFPLDPRLDVFQVATVAEKALVSPIRVHCYVFRRGQGFNGVKGTAIAFPRDNHALFELSRLPNDLSPFVVVREQRQDGRYPAHPQQRVRRDVVLGMFYFLRELPHFREIFDDERVTQLQNQPETRDFPELVTITVTSSSVNEVTAGEVSDIVMRETQRSIQESQGATPREPIRITLTEPRTAFGTEQPPEHELEDVAVPPGDLPLDPLMRVVQPVSGIAADSDDEEVELDVSDSESADDVSPFQQDFEERNFPTEGMGHVEAPSMTVLDSREIGREPFLESLTETLRSQMPSASVSSATTVVPLPDGAQSNQPSTPILEVPFVHQSAPLRATDPLFFPFAYPDIFCDTNGVPQYPNGDLSKQAMYPVLSPNVKPEEQIAHVHNLGCLRGDGRLVFPLQSNIACLSICRNLTERKRISNRCSWTVQQTSEVRGIETIVEWLRDDSPVGRQKLAGVVSRSQVASIGGPTYLKQKYRMAKEVTFQLPPPNLFVTLSFPDTHHPALLNCLGVKCEDPYNVRQEAVAAAPGLAVQVYKKFKEDIYDKLFKGLLGAEYAVDRDEFQARFSIHSHMVIRSSYLDFSKSVAAYVKGKAAMHLLFKRLHPSEQERAPEPPPEMTETEFAELAQYAVCEERFDEEGISNFELDSFSENELVVFAKDGLYHEQVIRRAAQLFFTASHPAVQLDPSLVTSLTDYTASQADFESYRQLSRQMMRDFAERNKDQVHPMDVVSFVMKYGDQMTIDDACSKISARTMVHVCQPDYCYNTKERKRDKICRFLSKMNSNFSSTHTVRLEFRKGNPVPSVIVEPDRNHPELMPFNRVMMAVWGANCDFKIIFDPDHVLRYILKYTLKKDVSKIGIDQLSSMIKNGQSSQVRCSGSLKRLAERVNNGDFTDPVQFISSFINCDNSLREIGAPELSMVVLGKPIVQFRNIKFNIIPNLLNAARLSVHERQDGEEGVSLVQNCWSFYVRRLELWTDEAQKDIRKVPPDKLSEMSAADFFGNFYIRGGIVKEHEPGNRVTIWPAFSDVFEHNPDNEKYFLWAKWFLLRFVPFTCSESLIPDYLTILYERASSWEAPASLVLPSLENVDLKREDQTFVQRLIVNIFKLFVLFDRNAKYVYENKITRFKRIEKLVEQIREETTTMMGSMGGFHNSVDRGQGGDVPEFGVDTAADSPPDASVDASIIPGDLRATDKTELLPDFFRGLDPATLDLIAESGKNHLANIEGEDRQPRELSVMPMVPEQQYAYDVITSNIERGGAVFLHGGPGSGKSNVIKHLIRDFGNSVVASATTAKAGFLLNADTVHSRAYLHVPGALSDEQIRKLVERFQNKELAIVDESSMMGTDMARLLEDRLRTNAFRIQDTAWGGFRMSCCGDFGQCPPVKSGKPFHTSPHFSDFEVVLLEQSHRVTDQVSKGLIHRMRTRTLVPGPNGDGVLMRRLSCPQFHRERAARYANDPNVFHLVTTNKEVDEINTAYIQQYARSHNLKMGIAYPNTGAPLFYTKSARVTVLKNIQKAYGVTNGLMGKVVGSLFAENTQVAIQGTNPKCILIRPECEGEHDRIDTGWSRSVEKILQENRCQILVDVNDANSGYRPLNADDISRIVESTKGVVPISEVTKCKDDDFTENKVRWESSFPLRLARAVTVHKLQGMSVDDLILTPGSKKMFGTTLTGITRARGGFDHILFAGNYDDVHLVDDLNADPGPDYDLVIIDRKMRRMAERTRRRFEAGTLYQPDPLVHSGQVDVTLTNWRRRTAGSNVPPNGASTTDAAGSSGGNTATTATRGRGRGGRGGATICSRGSGGNVPSRGRGVTNNAASTTTSRRGNTSRGRGNNEARGGRGYRRSGAPGRTN